MIDLEAVFRSDFHLTAFFIIQAITELSFIVMSRGYAGGGTDRRSLPKSTAS